MTEQRTFPVLATVVLGRLNKGYLYLEALRHMGVLFANSAEDLVPRVVCADAHRDVDLVVVTPADLGINVADRYERFFAAAVERGLELCPAEVGPALLITPMPDAFMYIAMKPIDNPMGLAVKFQIGPMAGKKCLSTQAPSFVSPNDRWIFIQPRG